MYIVILENTKKVAKLISDRPEVLNATPDGYKLYIESNDINKLVNFLEKYGLHLIANGDNYLVALQINEQTNIDTIINKAKNKINNMMKPKVGQKSKTDKKKEVKDKDEDKKEVEKTIEREKKANNVEKEANAVKKVDELKKANAGGVSDYVVNRLREFKQLSKKVPSMNNIFSSSKFKDIFKDPAFIKFVDNLQDNTLPFSKETDEDK